MGLTAAGIGSNLPIETMITQLMSIEQQPIRTLEKKIAAFQSKISAIGTVKSSLSAFQTAVKNLSEASKFSATTATSGNPAAFTASATGTAAPATYSLEVSQLAQAQKLAATGQMSATAAIGSGTISIELGTLAAGVFTPGGAAAKTVTIDPLGDTSLNGIRDAINKAKIGVTASIVNDGTGTPYRLVMTQEATGAANSMRISVAGDAALGTLLNHNGVSGLEQTVNAQNAQFKLDGISVSSASNTVTTAIDGVTMNLAKTNVGSPASLAIGRDTAAITTAVKEFVTAYNAINKTLGDLTSYNPATKTGGVLNGDSTIRGIQSQLRGMLSTPVATGTSITVLSDIGVSIKSGVMALDETALKKVIDTKFDDLAGVFADVGGVKGYAAQFNDWTASLLKSDSAFMARTEGLNTSIKSLEANKERINDRLADTEKRLRAQFSALDTMVAKMNSTSAYLAQQLASLSNND